MSPVLLVVAAGPAVAGVVVLVVALRAVRAVRERAADVDARCHAVRVELAARRARDADELAEMQQLAEEAVDAGAGGVRDVHRAIAGVPFDLLDSLPATRAASQRARQVHDRTADGVYDAVAAANRAAGGIFRALRRRRE